VDKDREKRPERKFVVGEGAGPELAAVEKTITIEMCQAFSGPHRSYHTDREMAQALGFPDIAGEPPKRGHIWTMDLLSLVSYRRGHGAAATDGASGGALPRHGAG
jgi:hypothetical protein